MKDFWRRLGTSDSISWFTYPIAAALAVVAAITSSGAKFSNNPFGFFLAIALEIIAMSMVFGLGTLALRFLGGRKYSPLLTVAIFEFALATRAFVFDTALIQVQLESSSKFLYRFTSSQPYFFVGLLMVASVTTYSREVSKNNQELGRSINELQDMRTGADREISSQKDSLLGTIKTQLDENLILLERHAGPEFSLKLQKIIDETVRPLSYELSEEISNPITEKPLKVNSKIDWQQTFKSIFAGNPISVLYYTVSYGVSSPLVVLSLYGNSTFPAIVRSTLATAISLISAKQIWNRISLKLSTPLRGLFFGITYTVAALIAVFALNTNSTTLVSGWQVAAIVLQFLISALGIALVNSVLTRRREVNLLLQANEFELRREIAKLNARIRDLQVGISRMLHGPIQDAFTSALRLSEKETEKSLDPEELVRALRTRISETFTDVGLMRTKSRNIDLALRDIVELWDGVMTIRFNLDSSVAREIESDPQATETLIELVREATANGVTHGDAKDTDINIELDESKTCILLSVKNNGQRLVESPQLGIGSKLFDELTIEWSREQVGEFVEVRATIPISNVSSNTNRKPPVGI